MVVRAAVVLGSLLAVTPVLAEPMNADAARRFVAGKLFSFTCFEGSSGTGRIFNDGSVAGVVRMRVPARCVSCACRPERFTPRATRSARVKGAFSIPASTSKTSERSFAARLGLRLCLLRFHPWAARNDRLGRAVAGRQVADADAAFDPPARRASTRPRPEHRERPAAPSAPVAAAPTTPVTAPAA
jgi:hypothetical protein